MFHLSSASSSLIYEHTHTHPPLFLFLSTAIQQKMKQDSLVFIVFLLFAAFLLYSCPISTGRLPPQNQGEKRYLKFNEIADGVASTIQEDNFFNMMASESVDCSEKDEECVKRRLIAEAHLDYVYTQHHKP